MPTSDAAKNELDFLQSKPDCCLVIDGESLQVSAIHTSCFHTCDLSIALLKSL